MRHLSFTTLSATILVLCTVGTSAYQVVRDRGPGTAVSAEEANSVYGASLCERMKTIKCPGNTGSSSCPAGSCYFQDPDGGVKYRYENGFFCGNGGSSCQMFFKDQYTCSE